MVCLTMALATTTFCSPQAWSENYSRESVDIGIDVFQKVPVRSIKGEFHDQGDAKWIVINGPLRGHNNMPCGLPAPGRPIGHPGFGRPQGIISVF
jgi:hypothetical protein